MKLSLSSHATRCVRIIIALSFLLVSTLTGPITVSPAVSSVEPSWGIEIDYGGDLVLRNSTLFVLAEGKDFRVSGSMTFESNGKSPVLNVDAEAEKGVSLQNAGALSIAIDMLHFVRADGSTAYYFGGPGFISIGNATFPPFTTTTCEISYRINVESIIRASQVVFASHHPEVGAENVTVRATAILDFAVISGVGFVSVGDNDVHYSRMSFACNAAIPVTIDMTVGDANSKLLSATIDNANMALQAPFHAEGKFVSSIGATKIVYAEWQVPRIPSTVVFQLSPLDWIAGGVVALLLERLPKLFSWARSSIRASISRRRQR